MSSLTLAILGILVGLSPAIVATLVLFGIDPDGAFSSVLRPLPPWLIWVLAAVVISILPIPYGVRRFRRARARSNAFKTARDDAISYAKRLDQEQFRDVLRQRHANVKGMKWLYDWNARYRYGRTDTPVNERALQLIDDLINSKVLDPSDRLRCKKGNFRDHLAKLIAEEESELGHCQSKPAPA